MLKSNRNFRYTTTTWVFVCWLVVLGLIRKQVSAQAPGSPGGSSAPTTTAGAYTRLSNVFCLAFSGNSCTSCDTDLSYYLYGNECFKYQNRRTDYIQNGPIPQIVRVCDAQCGDNSCLQTGSDTGLCTGCIQTSTASAFYGHLNSGTGGQKKYQTCVTDCDHFGTYYGATAMDSTGYCASCPSNCETCDSGSVCTECSYSYKRYSGSSASFSNMVFYKTVAATSCASQGPRSVTTAASTLKDYYLVSTASAFSCSLGSCQGTFNSPYDDINLILQDIQDVFFLGQKTEATINIYLMKKTAADGTVLNHTWTDQNLAPHYSRVFERTAVDVSIQPLVCDGSSITTNCYSSSEKATVILKSNKIFFFVTKTFTFKNIIMDGSELIPDSDCYNENKGSPSRCCKYSQDTYPSKSGISLSGGGSNDAQCSPPTSASTSDILDVPWEEYEATNDVWKKGPYALFVVNFLRDYPQYIPTLTISGCVFQNFWYHRYARSLIYLDQRAAKLTITDTTFERFYFSMGLITNNQQLTQRNSFFTTNLISTSLGNCTSDNPLLSNCHSLTIKDSVFSDSLFGDYLLNASNSDYYSNEGIVLSLLEFAGPISIQGNTFSKLSSLKFSFPSSHDDSAICSEPRASFDSDYRLSLDRHMQMVIGNENWGVSPQSSSVLSIRNVTYGLAIYNNIFTNNIMETGTGLFVHNFKNTQNYPIVIEKNTFNANFATEFGTAIAIIKYERDYVTLDCKGVYLANNIFEDNFGCPYVKGTVIVSCTPDKPNISPMSSFYDIKQGVDTQSYLLGYFVSTNDADTLQATNPGATASRYTDLSVSETDALTMEIFSKFTTDIASNKATVNATAHPIISGTSIDTNRVTSTENTFSGNYALHSQLFLQGAYNSLVQGDTFKDNSVPVPDFITSGLYEDLPLFVKALSNVSYWTVTESTPLMIRMSNYIQVEDSTFDNNNQILVDSLSLAFGACITIDKHLGKSDVSLKNNKFENNQGWGSSDIFALINSTIKDQKIRTSLEFAFDGGFAGSLITYNYWEYMYGVQIYDSTNKPGQVQGFYEYLSSTPNIAIEGSTFYNNIFNAPSLGPIDSATTWARDYRTSVLRLYSAKEGISTSDDLTATYSNSYGSYVKSVSLTFDYCTFSLNVIEDDRSFLNPYGFSGLTVTNSIFEGNTIEDSTTGTIYSLRTYLYSYYVKGTSVADFAVKNVTFSKNAGKIAYFEDATGLDQSNSATKYTVSLEDITITDHVSGPDFLFYIVNKDYLTLSSITVVNAASNLGFMFLNAPKDHVEIDSLYVYGVEAARVGCLYVESLTSDTTISNITCEAATVNSSSLVLESPSISTSSDRLTTIDKSSIPISSCFALNDVGTKSIDTLKCVSPVLIGTSQTSTDSSDSSSSDDTSLPIMTLCLYFGTNKVFSLPNFVCKSGTMKNISSSSEDTYLAYFDSPASITFTDATFEDNSVAHQSIMIDGGKAFFTDSTFTGNTAGEDGSAIVGQANVKIEITGCTFSKNTCTNCEGAISLQTGTLIVSGSDFSENEASSAGAISLSLVTVTISSCNFTSNSVTSLGSAISADLCTAIISGCTFTKNFVEAGEAALSFYQGSVTLKDSYFYYNSATLGTRNVKVMQADALDISGCYFYDSGETSLPFVKGGFLYISSTSGKISGSTFEDARGNMGGAIYLEMKSSDTFSIKSSKFTKCRARKQGEVLYLTGGGSGIVSLEDVEIASGTPSDYKSNKKDLYAIYSDQITLQLKSVTFNPALAETDTGNQLYLYKGSDHKLESVIFSADCTSAGNCDRSIASALRLLEVKSLTATGTSFTGWGNSTITSESATTETASYGGAVRIDFPASRVSTDGYSGTYTFTNCIWSGNEGKYGGALYALGVMAITIDGCSFDSNTASADGGAIYWSSTSTSASLTIKGATSFTDNEAEDNGGAFYYAGRPIGINSGAHVTYSGNTAQYGANFASYAVYAQLLDDPDPSIYESYITSSSSRLLEETTTYASGATLSPPMVLAVYDELGQRVTTDNSSTITVTATTSGKSVTVSGNPFTAENGYVVLYPLKVYSNPGSTITFGYTLTSFSASSVGRTLGEFDGLYTPSSETIDLRVCILGERLADDLSCAVCSSGTYTTLTGSTDACIECPIGGICEGYDEFGPDVDYWKMDYSTETVVECLNSVACLGASVDSDSTESLYCASVRSADPTFCYSGWCAEGYQGNLCADCQSGYAYSNTETKTCTKCSDNPRYYVISVFLGIGGACYIIFLIKSALKEPKPESEKDKDKEEKDSETEKQKEIKSSDELGEPNREVEKIEQVREEEIGSPALRSERTLHENESPEPLIMLSSPEKTEEIAISPIHLPGSEDLKQDGAFIPKETPEDVAADLEELSLPSTYLKILTNYLQLISIIGVFNFEWPDQVQALFTSTSKASQASESFFSFDCLLRQPAFVDIGMSSFFAKLLVMALSPVAFGFLIIAVWYLIYGIKYRRNLKQHKTRLEANIITSMVVTLFLLHPSIVELAIESFKCTQLGDSSSDVYLDGNLEIKCWESEHLKWAFMVGLPSLVVWGFGLPIAAIWMLRRNREKLHLESVKAKFGFLYEGYFAKTYYWESIIFYRKMILILISVFMSNSDPQVTGAIVIGVSVANYMIQIKANPYLTDVLNEMETRSLIASAITIYCGLFYLSEDLGSVIKMVFFGGLLVANLYFFMYFGVEYIKAQSEELLKIKIVNKLFGRCLRSLAKFNWEFKIFKKKKKAPEIQISNTKSSSDLTPREDSVLKVLNVSGEGMITKKGPGKSLFRKAVQPSTFSSPEITPAEVTRGERAQNDNFSLQRTKSIEIGVAAGENTEGSYPIKRAFSVQKAQIGYAHDENFKTIEGLLEVSKPLDQNQQKEEQNQPIVIHIHKLSENNERKTSVDVHLLDPEAERSSNNLLNIKADNSPSMSFMSNSDLLDTPVSKNENENEKILPSYMKPLNRGYKRPKSQQKVEEFVFGSPEDLQAPNSNDNFELNSAGHTENFGNNDNINDDNNHDNEKLNPET